MGSKRKKAEKQKDFVKKKLKVGKTAAKPDNHTDTSFAAKTISLPNQSSLTRKQASDALGDDTHRKEEVDLTHHLSLVKHHSSTTRKEVLTYIEQHLPSNPSLYKNIITTCVPLIVDPSQQVRNQLSSLLTSCAKAKPGLLDLHIKAIVLFIHSAMSHISPDIRNSSSIKFLSILVDHSAQALVRSYFIKTLRLFFTLLAWTLEDDKKSISLAITTSASTGGATKKARIGHLIVLRKFLEAAVFPNEEEESKIIDISNTTMVHPLSGKYLIPTVSRPFAPLKLFVKEIKTSTSSSNGASSGGKAAAGANGVDDGTFTLHDLQSLSTEDLDTRKKVMKDVFVKPMVKNLNNFIKEGGEVGREANSIMGLIEKLQKGEAAAAAGAAGDELEATVGVQSAPVLVN